MVETALAVHLSVAPLADITMTILFITALLLRPNIHTETILDAIFYTASILT